MSTFLRSLPLTFVLLLASCGSSEPVEVVDMDKVLEIFDRVTSGEVPAEYSEAGATEVAPLERENAELTKQFLAAFSKELNAAKLSRYPMGILMLESGAIEGFRDLDGSGMKDAREPAIFKIEIDPENNRVVATQQVADQTYRRDRSYRHHRYHGGYWGYWMMGSMWGRQRSYYSSPSRVRPSYGSMKMAPTGYHRSAVSRARSSSGSARSRGGSRSFGGGK